jgi:hypothetical protein
MFDPIVPHKEDCNCAPFQIQPAITRAELAAKAAAESTLQQSQPQNDSTPGHVENVQPEPQSAIVESASAHASSSAWKKIEDVFTAEFHEPDMMAVRAIYSAVAAHFLKGQPVWMFEIAPPSSGKTEKLMPLKPAVGAEIISSVTPQTFISGSIAGPQCSLLTRLGDCPIIVCKDFSQVLSMPKNKKGQILADLRDIYDGHIAKEYGTQSPRREWSGRLTFIAATTPALDHHYSIFQALGERFIQVRSKRPGGVQAALRALNQKPANVREHLNNAVIELFAGIGGRKVPVLNAEQELRIANLAEFVVRARTQVPRDGHTREILCKPEPESSPRLVQQLTQLAKGSALLDARTHVDETDISLVRRVAFDTMPVTAVPS